MRADKGGQMSHVCPRWLLSRPAGVSPRQAPASTCATADGSGDASVFHRVQAALHAVKAAFYAVKAAFHAVKAAFHAVQAPFHGLKAAFHPGKALANFDLAVLKTVYFEVQPVCQPFDLAAEIRALPLDLAVQPSCLTEGGQYYGYPDGYDRHQVSARLAGQRCRFTSHGWYRTPLPTAVRSCRRDPCRTVRSHR